MASNYVIISFGYQSYATDPETAAQLTPLLATLTSVRDSYNATHGHRYYFVPETNIKTQFVSHIWDNEPGDDNEQI